jgi:multidrug efflux pump subunit AcrB
MQPVQDITVEDRVSRTQYQYTLEDPNQDELNRVVHNLVAKLKPLPQLADVVTDQQLDGLAAAIDIDRPSASRFGITPQSIDNTLYDAFGQRQINTMYTQENQYHVILEADPNFQLDPSKLRAIYIQSSSASSSSSGASSNTAGSSSGAGSGSAPSTGNALLSPSATTGVSGPVSVTSALTASSAATSSAATTTVNTRSALSPASTAASNATVVTSTSGSRSISSSANTSTSGTTRSGSATVPAEGSSSAAGGGTGSTGGAGGGAAGGTSLIPSPVPLGTFSQFSRQSEALAINRQGQFPSVTISFNLADGYSLGQALDAMNAVIARAKLPASVIANFQGTAAAFEGSLANEGLLVLAALVVVYIVLGVLYESFIHPITILSTLPSAGVGALLALELFHLDLGIVAIIGIILLIGIVKKNGIMMVDFALEAERTQGMNANDAIYQASLLRFRPILMTTMAALLSGIPLAAGTGIGSELRRPLGVVMVGGLIFSQVLTLYTTPVIYIFFDTLGARLFRRRPGRSTIGEPEGET